MTRKQEQLLQLLREIDAICRKHHLRYVMAGGSLIGVIRHEGFVPWDDDVDIYMPRKDWEILVSLADTEFPPERTVLCVDVARNYTNTFPRYGDTSGCVIHRHQIISDDTAGEIIDVLTLDPIPEDDEEYKKYRTHMMIYSDLVNPFTVYGDRWDIPVTVYWKYLLSMKFLGRDRTLKKLEEIMFSWKEEECGRYAMRWGGCPFLFDKDMMFPVKYGKFEDLEVMIPARTSDYLIWHYGDEWSYIPDHDERTSHMTVTVEGAGYEDFRKEYMPGLDRRGILRAAFLRKSWRMLTAGRNHRIMDERTRLYGKSVSMDLEARLKREKADIGKLVRERRFDLLGDLLGRYLQTQCSEFFVGREDFYPIYRFYHPILIEVEEDVFEAAVMTLFYTERVGKAARLLQVKEQAGGSGESGRALMKDISEFRRAVRLYESRDMEAAETLCLALLGKYPGHPGLLKLRCRFVMERAEKQGKLLEAWEFFEESAEYFPEDSYFLKYQGDLLWMEGQQEKALELYGKVRREAKNGIVQLELDRFLGQKRDTVLAEIERRMDSGCPEEAEELLKRWRTLLPDERALEAEEFYLRVLGASENETAALEEEAARRYREAAEAHKGAPGESDGLRIQKQYFRALVYLARKAGYSGAAGELYAQICVTTEPEELRALLEKAVRPAAGGERSGIWKKLEGDIHFQLGCTDLAYQKYREALNCALPEKIRETLAKKILRDWYHGGRRLAAYARKTDASRYMEHWLGKYGSLEELQGLAAELALR